MLVCARIFVSVLIFGLFLGPTFAGPLEDVNAAYQRGDYATALQLVRPLAEQGNTSAQVLLGGMYEKGLGIPQDYAQAVNWYRKAANQGDADAQFLTPLLV